MHYCTNCGNQRQEEEPYCTNCGTDFNKEHVSVTKTEINKFEEKVWFRFLKVFYVVIYSIVVLTTGVIIYSSKPAKQIDNSTSLIICDNGSSYPLAKNHFFVTEDLSFQDDLSARILCKYDTLNFDAFSNESIPKNYTFKPIYLASENNAWLRESLLGILIVWIVIKLLKIGVLYIVTGLKPYWKREFKKLF